MTVAKRFALALAICTMGCGGGDDSASRDGGVSGLTAGNGAGPTTSAGVVIPVELQGAYAGLPESMRERFEQMPAAVQQDYVQRVLALPPSARERLLRTA